VTSAPHDLDAVRRQERELDTCEAEHLRQDAALRYRHAMAAVRLTALRDRQQALAARKCALQADDSPHAATPAAPAELEPRAQLAAASGARLSVAAERREHLALLGAALQNWERHLELAEAAVDRALQAEDARAAAWAEREPGWRRSGVPPLPEAAQAAQAIAVALPTAAAMPVGETAPSTGAAAAATQLPAPRVAGRRSGGMVPGAHVDAHAGDEPLPSGPTKRMITTPLFRPANSPTVTGAVPMAPGPAAAARSRSEPRPVAAMPAVSPAPPPPPPEPAAEPQPRTRVLVDSAPEVLARHAETVSIEPSGAEAAVVAARSRAKRRSESPPVRKRDSRGLPTELPADLPAAHPGPLQRHRDATAPFLATLTYCGLPLMRQSIEYDPAGASLLLSFHGAAPALQTDGELLWRDRDGTRHRFSVLVLQAVPAQGGGTVVVLDIAHWSAQDRAAMQAVMARLL